MYDFYIDGVLLPVTPSKLQTKISNQNKSITLMNGVEVNVLKKPGLTEIDFEVVIPQVNYPYAVYKDGFKDAKYYLDKFEALKNGKKTFQFIVSRVSQGGDLLFDTNIKVSLEDYTITEDAKEGLDVTVAIKLKQYIEYGTKVVVVVTTVAATSELTTDSTTDSVQEVSTVVEREVSKETDDTYTVVSGDTLWGICKKNLGDGSKYAEIAELNGISNPNLIYPGQVIKLG